jgi:BarH-like protein
MRHSLIHDWNRGSSVSIVSGRPGDRGSIPGIGERIFPLACVSRLALGLTQPPVQWVPWDLSPAVKRGKGVTLTTHSYLVPRSWMSRSYNSSPLAHPSCVVGALTFTCPSLLSERLCSYATCGVAGCSRNASRVCRTSNEPGRCSVDNNSSSSSSCGPDERKKRPRTAFTAAQIKSLEAEFEKNKYLSVAKRLQLSKSLKLTETQVCSLVHSVLAFHVDRVRRCLWSAAINGSTAHLTGDIWVWEPWWNDIDRENRRTRRKICPNATLSTITQKKNTSS